MKLPHQAHVAIADGTSFVLFRNQGAMFEPRLIEEDKPELEVTNFSAGSRDGDQIGRMLGRTDLKELGHGAAVAEWLNAKAIAGEIEQLLIIADPKTLGEMRLHYHSELRKKLVGELDKTLSGQPTEKIEKAIEQA
ncbi:attachment protein [Altererythrobacter sp. BO-6]|uniref:baeRF12 domain-containing protein n=1 Tax=Altererythrobacter sp. BO-6 TaxID=2604537 RepID=UPI0013E1DE1B|nr:host attachment protein [Altererythrobacter sp. BO-6]QIG54453.1 attachment protein [Altererythrobacter sp. BO-6]